jgi:hypothetical protein
MATSLLNKNAPLYRAAARAARNTVSSLAIVAVAFSSAVPAMAQTPVTIDQAADRSEAITAYHAIQGYQLDTPDSSISGSRRVMFGRKRLGDKSIVVVQKGNGVQLSGINDNMVVMPHLATGRERDVYGYDWETKNMFAKDGFQTPFNKIVAPLIRANRNRPKDTSFQLQMDAATLSSGEMTGETATFRFTREFAQHKGETYVLIGYDVPAFQYTNKVGQDVLHWASGFIITDPSFATLYYYGAKNMGTRQPMTQFAEPLSARVFTYATDKTGNRLLDISDFKKAQDLIDKAVQGGTEYAPTKRAATPQPFHDTGFFQMARMVDMTGSGVGENSGNQAPQGSNTTLNDVGTASTRVVQAKNGWNYMRFKLGYMGTEETAKVVERVDDIYNYAFDFREMPDLIRSNALADMEEFGQWWSGQQNATGDVLKWFEDGLNGVVRNDGAGKYLAKIFGQNADEFKSTLRAFGVSTAEGIGKILGPIAWTMSAYTVSQGFDYDAGQGGYIQDPNTGQWVFKEGTLIGPNTGGYVDGIQLLDRVVVDVGLGVYLDLATGDVVGFALDGSAVVVKSFTDVYRAMAYYGNSLKDQQLSEATRAEILGANYGRQRPVVDSNLPGLLDAEANRTGQDWSWALQAASTKSGEFDWKKFRYSLPFSFEIVEWDDPQNLLEDLVFDFKFSQGFGPQFNQAQQKLNTDKLTELNFKMALMRFLQGRNPTVPEVPPGVTPPKPEDPDDPGSTGTVTTTTTETRDPGPTGTVTTTTAETNADPGPTGTVTSSTTPTRPGPEPTRPTVTPRDPAVPRGTRFGETVIVSALDQRIQREPKAGWYNNLAYDRDGNFLGYVPLYFLSNPKPPSEETPEDGDNDTIDAEAIEGTETGGIVIAGDPGEDPLKDDPLENSETGAIFWDDGEYRDPSEYTEAIDVITELLLDESEMEAMLERYREELEEAERRARGFSGSPLGEKYPNQVDYGDGSYPNQIKIDWEKFDPNANYPNPYSPEWKKWDPSKKYPNQTVHDWKKWDPTKPYPNQVPSGFAQTPYNYDSFQDFIDQNAFKYANMSGFFPPNMAAYEDFIALYGLDYLDALARRAGFPSIWAALGDWEFLAWQSTDKNFINAAMNFTCNVRWGVNYDCIGKNAQERAQLELGRILNESRGLFSDAGLSDITISSSNLRYMLRDFGVEDGDIVDVTVTQFGRTIFTGRTNLTNAGTSTSVNVRPGVSSIELTAVNEGRLRPNTAEINFENVTEGEAVQTYSLSEGETGTLKVRVQP